MVFPLSPTKWQLVCTNNRRLWQILNVDQSLITPARTKLTCKFSCLWSCNAFTNSSSLGWLKGCNSIYGNAPFIKNGKIIAECCFAGIWLVCDVVMCSAVSVIYTMIFIQNIITRQLPVDENAILKIINMWSKIRSARTYFIYTVCSKN